MIQIIYFIETYEAIIFHAYHIFLSQYNIYGGNSISKLLKFIFWLKRYLKKRSLKE